MSGLKQTAHFPFFPRWVATTLTLLPNLHPFPCEYNFRNLLCEFSLSCQGLDAASLPGKMPADSTWENPLGYSHLCTHFLRTDGIL